MSDINTTTAQDKLGAAQPYLENSHKSALIQETLLGLSITQSTTAKQNVKPVVTISRCPYHRPILNLIDFPGDKVKGSSGLLRYFQEKSEHQGPIFLRPDNGIVSLHKSCTCEEHLGEDGSKL